VDPVRGRSGRSERGRSLRASVAARGLPAVAARPCLRRSRAAPPGWDVPGCWVLTARQPTVTGTAAGLTRLRVRRVDVLAVKPAQGADGGADCEAA
jgi:hypothetical protein